MARVKKGKRKSGIRQPFDENKAKKLFRLLEGRENSALDVETNVRSHFITMKMETMKLFWGDAPNSRNKLEEFMRVFGCEVADILETNPKKKAFRGAYSPEKLGAEIERFLNKFKFKDLNQM